MRVRVAAVESLAFAVTLGAGSVAWAQVPPGTEPASVPPGTEPASVPPGTEPASVPPGTEPASAPVVASGPARVSYDHRYQVGLRAGVASGYRLTIRYRDGFDTDPCALDAGQKFCGDLVPLLLDTALGFGVSEGVELDARMRLGLTTDFDGSRPLQVGLGLRALGEPVHALKFFGGVTVLLDVTAGRLRQGGDFDVIARGELGLQYDFARWFGFYVTAGGSFGFVRNFSLLLDGGLGVQFRAP